MSDDLTPPADAVKWAYWFLEPSDMQASSERPPHSGPYMNYATLADWIIRCDMAMEATDHE